MCFQCWPPLAAFSVSYSGQLATPAKCSNFNTIVLVLSISHVAMDFLLLMVPIIVLWRVNLPWTTKCRLYLVFSTGAMSCIGSVLRQLEQESIDLDSTCKYYFLSKTCHVFCYGVMFIDFTVTGSYTGILAWTVVDLGFGLLTASLPVIIGLLPQPSPSSRVAGTYYSHSVIPTTQSRAYLRSTIHTHIGSSQASQVENLKRNRLRFTGSLHSESDRQGILVKEEIELSYLPACHTEPNE